MRPPPATAPWLLPIVVVVIATGGCSVLSTAVGERSRVADLPATDAAAVKQPPRTIALEVTFVRCDDDDPALREEIWRHVDEQVLDDPRRRALNANGLRAGVVTGHLPAELAARLAASAAEPVDVAGVDPARARRLLNLLPGRGGELVTAHRLPSLVLFEQRDGEVRGETFEDATPQFALDASPAADGRIRLELVPEVRHGPVEKSWAGEDGVFRLETGQRRHRMEHLGIDVTVPAGGLLLVGCAGEAATTVGDGLLRDQGDGDRGPVRLLAIRPLARTTDPAFTESVAATADDEGPRLPVR
ncbi:MAG: hypothetical protein ACKO40_15575 [Planctomycetaceae bacterium]